MIEARYRRDYDGEFVVTSVGIVNGRRQEKREWIPNPLENHHISGRAAVIGSDADFDLFDSSRLQRHKGGLLGKKKLQTYGTDSVWQKMSLDFYVTIESQNLADIHQTNYFAKTAVYTTSRYCLQYPGDFYLIPYSPQTSDPARAVYLAAFDGHQEIFLLGYGKNMPARVKNWQQDVFNVMSAYSGTKFYLVGVEANQQDQWRHLDNVQTMEYRRWVSYCDV